MQTNQLQTKPQHPMVNTILANIEAHKKQELVSEPLRSIDKVLQHEAQQAAAKVIADTKLYTPAQNEALTLIQAALYEIAKLTDMINTENAVWNLGLSTLNAYAAGDMLGEVQDRIRILHQIAHARGVQAVIDNKGGASQYKELQNQRQHLENSQEKTNAYYQSKQIQKQKEAA